MNGATIRNANLDLIKCIACLCVVGLHAVGMSNYTIYYLCDCGVPLFFMVNGYLLLSRKEVNYAYAFRKIIHILKVVFLWNLLIAIPVFIFRRKLVNPFRLTFDSLMQKGYLWHFWFFGALILLYLLLPLLHKLVHGKKRPHRAVCFVLMCLCLYMSITSMVKGYPLHMFVPQPLRLWTWLFYFLLGGLFAELSAGEYRISPSVHGALLILFTIINNFSQKRVGLYLTHSRLAEYFYDDFSSIVWYALLFTFLLRIPIKEKAASLISRLSNLTMGIFIIHPILLTALNTVYLPQGNIATLAYWAGLTAVSCLISYIMMKLPIIKILIKN